jgi:hypothetical protein
MKLLKMKGMEDRMEEYKDIKKGPVEIYTHKQHLLVNDDGLIVMIRCSFSKTKFFLRSACYLKPEVNELTGKAYIRKVPLETFHSAQAEERDQLIGMEELDEPGK